VADSDENVEAPALPGLAILKAGMGAEPTQVNCDPPKHDRIRQVAGPVRLEEMARPKVAIEVSRLARIGQLLASDHLRPANRTLFLISFPISKAMIQSERFRLARARLQ
jgi:hypothetical protein